MFAFALHCVLVPNILRVCVFCPFPKIDTWAEIKNEKFNWYGLMEDSQEFLIVIDEACNVSTVAIASFYFCSAWYLAPVQVIHTF